MFGSTRRAVRARIAQAGLPADIAEFIGAVVRRTRLRRDEQLELANELVSHFAEGLAAGRTGAEIVAAYGDVKTSARELRRGAIAKRGAIDRAIGNLAKWSAVATGCFACGYLVYASALYLRSPVISLDAEAAANARMRKAGPDGRAIDLYMQALANAEGVYVPGQVARDAFDQNLFAIGFDAKALAAVKAAHEPLRARIALLRAVKDRPALGIPVWVGVWEDAEAAAFFGLPNAPSLRGGPLAGSLTGTLLPQLAMLREATRLLCADAALAAHEGRADDFVADIEAVHAGAGHAAESGFLISGLVAVAIRSIAIGTIVSAIENHAEILSDAQLARLEALVAITSDEVARGIEGERLMLRDIVQRCYSDDGGGDGVLLSRSFIESMQALSGWGNHARLSEAGVSDSELLIGTVSFLGGPVSANIAPSRRELLARIDGHIDGLIAATRAPTRKEGIEQAEKLDREWEQWSRGGWSVQPVSLLMPALGSVVSKSWGMRVRVDTALAAIGLERFRRANGRFPSHLAELNAFVARSLGSASDERVPWKYALVDGRPLIYDAGIDGLDDRARPPLEQWPARGSDEELAMESRTRLVSFDACMADGASRIGVASMRRSSAVSADAPLDPTQPIADVESGVIASDGDFIRVWWKSGATGHSRMVPASARP
jgi:hypothetical protein